MKQKVKLCTALFLATILIFGMSAISVSANSAQTWFEGVDSTGSVMPDEESPIIVEHELLKFDISEFPNEYYMSEEEYLSYTGRVTAEYTFYNPSEYTVTAKLLFPFGKIPMYSNRAFNDYGEYKYFDDTEKYDILINGSVTDKIVRHTLMDQFDEFVLERDIALIQDIFIDDDFFSAELSVTKYTFNLSEMNLPIDSSISIGMDITKGLGSYRIWFPEQDGMHIQDNNDMRIHSFIGNNCDSITLYIIGEPPAELPEWNIYRNGRVEDDEIIVTGRAELVATELMNFKELALQDREQDSLISEYDWYNAFVSKLKIDVGDYPVVKSPPFKHYIDGNLMRWYEYEIKLAPGERIVNTVTAPIYPDINLGYEPDIFEYTYLLSPAKTWKSFGDIEIVINTPYHISQSLIEGFEKTDTGYRLRLPGLPDSELEFTLSESLNPKKERSPYFWLGIMMYVVFAVLAMVIIGMLLSAVVLIVKVVKKKRHG